MLKINDRILMDIAKSYESYIRGRQYYESGRVSNVKFNKEVPDSRNRKGK